MKKLSEVCKTVGVTRRTLQEYNRIGLLCPTSKTESGYWLYDDAAIRKLIGIRIFVEVGYSCKKIKEIYENSESTLGAEFEKTVLILEQKKEEIQRKIEFVKMYDIVKDIPLDAFWGLIYDGPSMFYKDKSFTERMDDLRNTMMENEVDEKTLQEIMPYIPLIMMFYSIASLQSFGPDSTEVKNNINAYVKYCINHIMAFGYDDIDSWNECSENEQAHIVLEITKSQLNDKDNYAILTEIIGEKGMEFVKQAINAYSTSI